MLATRLAAAPGFVAWLLVATPGGGHAAVCICEDPASLAAADGLVAGWAPGELAGNGADPWRHLSGEVVAQKGL